MGNTDSLSREERAILQRLSSPEKIQYFLDHDIGYNKGHDGETWHSPRRVLRDRLAHCAEGAYFAAAALRVNGYPPLIVDLESVRDPYPSDGPQAAADGPSFI